MVSIVSCVNCGRKDATRTDDTFKCGTCGFEWDVAHEQKNAGYIRSALRRPPATPMGDIEIPSLQERMLQVMTPDELRQLAAAEEIDLGDAAKKAELIAVILQAREPDEAPDGESGVTHMTPTSDLLLGINSDTNLEALTIDELRALAAAEDIDLGSATKKAEIVAVITEVRAGR